MELKPCPKCGRELIQLQSTVVKPYRWQGVCVHCGFAGQMEDTMEQAINAWNGILTRL